jgi:hypothetical protein
VSSVSDFIDWPSCAATVVTGTPRRAARSRPRRKQNRRGRPLRAAFERIAKHRGRNIAKVAVARRVLTLCYHGLRDGEIRLRGGGKREEADRQNSASPDKRSRHLTSVRMPQDGAA